MLKKILLFLMLVSVSLVLATAPCRIPFQASGFKYANNTLIPLASVTTYIYVDPSGGFPVYSETWPSGLQDGYISVTMGNDTTGNPLNLDWGQTYWLAVNIDGVPITMVDGYGVSAARQAFVSTQGEIVQLTQVNASVVAQSIRIDTLNITIAHINGTLIPALYTNVSNLQSSNGSLYTRVDTLNTTSQNLLTSNNSIWTQLGLISSNFTSFTLSNTSIWSWIANAYVNMTNLQSSNGSAYTRTNTLNTTIAYLNGTLIPAMCTNMTNLQSSNGSIYTRVDTLNTSIQDLITSNNSAYTRTNTLNLTIAYINGTQIPALVPYTGAINNVTLGNYNMTASNYSVTGSGYIAGNSTCMRVHFNSTVWFGVGSACG
jgi:hypothetical protein